MSRDVVEIFKEICKIEHCSFDTQKLKNFIIKSALASGAKVQSDEAGNIQAIKGSPKLCLQSHYDMVCMGEAPHVEVIEEGGYLSAKNSSLGADNGIGVAMMLKLLQSEPNIECLFTNDEEVGLIGANNLELKIQSPNVLNLDTEETGHVYVGCAGGVDIIATCKQEFIECEEEFFEVSIEGLSGGHSGVQIDEGIPNAIKILAEVLSGAKIHSIEGGQRVNSIPTSSKAITSLHVEDSRFSVKSVGKVGKCLKNGEKIVQTLNAFSQGVRGFDKRYQIPNASINLSIISSNENEIKVHLMARANEAELLDTLKDETRALFELGGFEVEFEGRSLPWSSSVDDFTLLVQEKAKKVWGEAHLSVIHAGLECGALQAKQVLSICSIGPNIYSPHTINERCEVASVYQVFDIVSNIFKRL